MLRAVQVARRAGIDHLLLISGAKATLWTEQSMPPCDSFNAFNHDSVE